MKIRTCIGAFAFAALTFSTAEAQTASSGMFQTGSYYAGPRIWLGNLNGAVAIGGQIERGITEPGKAGAGIISGGFGIDFYSWSYDIPGYSWDYSVIPLQFFSNYHFAIKDNPKLDPYVGLALVYEIISVSSTGTFAGYNAEASGIYFAGQGGLRYFLNEKFALQGQIGFGYGTLGLGATWRF